MKKTKKHNSSPAMIIAKGFLNAVILGTILLLLPISRADGVQVSLLDTIFTATSSVCVTGLLTVANYSQWSFFGQLVILILIQMGGLGIITFTTIFMIMAHKRIGLKDRILIQNAYNLDSMKGVVKLCKRIFGGTLIVEGAGALCYMTVFIPEYGLYGIWVSIFNSISAFCNAGMDIIGADSLIRYSGNITINIVTMLLIILGGIGFPIWWFVIDSIKMKHKSKIDLGKRTKHQSLYIKMVFVMTGSLILLGTIVTFVLEYSNPLTIGNMSFGNKIMASVFQSVTWRTAGFATISQSGLHSATSVFGTILMFIGGSPSGTAGGIKTTTILILLVAVKSMLREENAAELFHRSISFVTVKRAMIIFLVSLLTLVVSLFTMCIFQEGSFMDIYYEVISALGTVGLSRDFTGSLNAAGKIIIILTMYLGRIGPISLAMFFQNSKVDNKIFYIEEKVSVG